MQRIVTPLAILGLTLSALGGCAAGGARPPARAPATIVLPRDTSPLETLAAREVRRYVYMRTGEVLPVVRADLKADAPPVAGDLILVSHAGRPLEWRSVMARVPEHIQEQELRPGKHILLTVRPEGRRVLLVGGADPTSTLYAAYRLVEHMGVRFYLHGDVVPDERTTVAALLEDLKGLEEINEPLFVTRGILPFHDFPEGPDWWDTGAYKAVLAQLPKMRMNFLGLHTYPEPAAEPTVWIGLPPDIGEGHAVKHSYPSSYHNTVRDMHGYKARKTSAWSHGAARLFDRDAYGADVMQGLCPRPTEPEDCNLLFGRVGRMLGEAFTFAHRLGIKTCVGTETPLKIPAKVQERLKALGKDPKDPAVVAEVYEGIFRRIMQTYPLDYYWFWTPEGWTWRGATQAQVNATLADFDAAIAAHKQVQPGFTLATCGWVLGPPKNRALFDEHLPGEMPMSCINRKVGKAPVEPGFAKVTGRPAWAIPWLEDDPNLLAPQLWVGRMRKDGADARAYGCTGLLGIHWRTRVLGPNVAALAHAAWNQEGWTDLPPPPKGNGRHAPSGDFYLDWCRSQFGPAVAEDAARIFQSQDGRLPEPSTWAHGPGGLKKSDRTPEQIADQYAFVDAFAALEPKVKGTGCRSRFRWWLHQFRFMEAVERLRSAWGRGDGAAMTKALDEAYAHLLPTVSTTGGLGTVANIEQHVLPMLEMTPEPAAYGGPTRLIVPAARTLLEECEPLDLKVIVLSEKADAKPVLHVRPLGGDAFREVACRHVARGVWQVRVDPPDGGDFEYYVDVPADGDAAPWPPTAPKICHTVVVMPGTAKQQ